MLLLEEIAVNASLTHDDKHCLMCFCTKHGCPILRNFYHKATKLSELR